MGVIRGSVGVMGGEEVWVCWKGVQCGCDGKGVQCGCDGKGGSVGVMGGEGVWMLVVEGEKHV